MARRAHVYPQVMLTAVDLVDTAVVSAASGMTAADAATVARKRGAGLVSCGDAGYALREDLGRAVTLGLGDVPAAALARPLPEVKREESELGVRRRLADGATAVVVTDGRASVGAVARAPRPRAISLAARLERTVDESDRALLLTAGRVAEALGARAFVVGGLVRDAWREQHGPGHDLDVVIEGEGLTVARALAAEVGGGLVEHERFLTASVTTPDGRRVDVVTARSERYDSPGALPRVMPATIEQDLRRRDFTVNAMAAALREDLPLLDPLGGIRDLARGHLRVLHPLSFVEDPTRMLRGARYAARLDLRLDAWTARCQTLAVDLAPYPALSGQRLAAELERVLADQRAARALGRLGRAGVFRIIDQRYRFTRATARAVAALPGTLAWTAAQGLAVPAFPIALLALVGDQPRRVATAWLDRLAVRGEPLARLLGALDARDEPSRASPLALAWMHLRGDAGERARLHAAAARARAARVELRGDEVIALGVPQGPAVGAVLSLLGERRRRGEIAERTAEIDYVRAWIREQQTDDERKG